MTSLETFRRQNDLERAEAKRALSKLFATFPTMKNVEDQRFKLQAYWEVLSVLPADAIVEACKQSSRYSNEFLPSASQIYKLGTKIRDRKSTKSKSSSLPEDKDLTDTERERMKVGYAQLLEELRSNNFVDDHLSEDPIKRDGRFKFIEFDDLPIRDGET